MSSSKLFTAALAVLSLPLLTTAHPTPTANTTNTTIYTLTDDLSSKNFFPSFSLFSSPDPTNGFVQYQNLSSAASASLLGYLSPNNSIYLGVDHITKDASGRASLRLESNKSWNRGVLVADIRHMSALQCGVWPAFWMLSASKTWPEGGEIDILEGVNEARGNAVTLHTSVGCVVEDRAGAGEFAGTMVTRNCDVDAPDQGKNAGCSIRAPDSGERVQMGIVREDMGEARAPSYGTGFNDAKGGVYAMEWTESSISVWFFPRNSPGYTEYFSQSNDTAATSPDPSTWGPPMARFSGSGCDFSERFVDMKIVFNTAFCGEWAGKVWDEECAAKTGVETCEEYVRGNPDAFREAYWEVEGLRWFQKS